MKLDPKQYNKMVRRAAPRSPVLQDCLWAFFVGGTICLLGEGLRNLYLLWYDQELAGTLTSISLIFLAAVCTMLGWYQKLGAKAGAGSLVPITGFANSVVSPAGGGKDFCHRRSGHCLRHPGQLGVGISVLGHEQGLTTCRVNGAASCNRARCRRERGIFLFCA